MQFLQGTKALSLAEVHQYYLKCKGLTTDSRKVEKGMFFLALKGPHFDGNQFASKALENGAAFAVVDDPSVVTGAQYLLVDDGLTALQALARYHRQQFTIPVIAITGSNGKTTTKELVNRVLACQYKVHCTAGNLNNHIGVPLTLLAMPLDSEIAIIEMGANHVGEIAALCSIALPNYGLITNIGRAHLEGFGGIEGVKQGKGELYDHLRRHHGFAFVNKDEPYLSELSLGINSSLAYGVGTGKVRPDLFVAELLQASPFIKTRFWANNQWIMIQSSLFGRYNFNNVVTAMAIGHFFEVSGHQIKDAITSYLPSNNRSQWLDWQGSRVLLDAYNANPTSMEHALRFFAALPEKPKGAVLGQMLELGEEQQEAHQRIAQLAKKLQIDAVILVGQAFKQSATELGLDYYDHIEALHADWPNLTIRPALLLLKGSRGTRVEYLIEGQK